MPEVSYEIKWPNKDGVIIVQTFNPATNSMQKEYRRCQKCLIRRSGDTTEIVWFLRPRDKVCMT